MGDSETDSIRDRMIGRPIVVRSDESRIRRWALFYGVRSHVAAALLAVVFATLLVLQQIWPIQFRILLDETTVVQSIFDTILGGVILLVSIVVAVAGVGVSQELTTIGEQDDRITEATSYRERLDLPDTVETLPAQPGPFLTTVLQTIQERADDLDSFVGSDESEVDERLAELTDNVERNASEVLETLDQLEAGTTEELLVGLDYEASWQLHQTNMLLNQHREDLSEETIETLERLSQRIRYFMVGREYFKSLYYKREFSELTKSLLIVSLPVIVFITYVLLALDTGLFPEVQVLGISPLALFVCFAYTVALAPYVVLSAYIFRAASVTKRTMSAGPFVHESGSVEYDLS